MNTNQKVPRIMLRLVIQKWNNDFYSIIILMKLQQHQQFKVVKFINSYDIKKIQITNQLQQLTLEGLIDYFFALFPQAKTSRMHLYRLPLSTFNKLDFLLENRASIKELDDVYGPLCLTYNNSQYIEQLMVDSFQLKQDDITLVIQICCNNIFTHQMYKINIKSKIILLKSLTERYGNKPYIRYYTYRIPLQWFKNNEIIQQVLQPMMVDDKLIITIDQYNEDINYIISIDRFHVNAQQYNLIEVVDYQISLINSKESNHSSFLYILNLIYKHQFIVQSEEIQTCASIKPLTIIKIAKEKSNNYLIEINLNSSVFIGYNNVMMAFISQNNIAHVFSSKEPFLHINSFSINQNNLIFFQDYFAYLKNNFLIAYEVSKKIIQLKYYKILSGDLQFVKNYKWLQQYGQVQIDSIDFFVVPFKNKPVLRCFYVDNPKEYYQIQKPEQSWKLFVNRSGQNMFSDHSNIFFILNHKTDTIKIFNFSFKEKLYEIKLSLVKMIQSIKYEQSSNNLLINMKQSCHKIALKNDKFDNFKKQNNQQVYCFCNGTVMILHQNYIKRQDGNKKRMNECLIKDNNNIFNKDNVYSFNKYKYIFVI